MSAWIGIATLFSAWLLQVIPLAFPVGDTFTRVASPIGFVLLPIGSTAVVVHYLGGRSRPEDTKWTFFLLIFLVFVVGLSLQVVPLDDHLALANDVKSKIGEALTIASLIAVVIDRAAKEKLLREFARDVSGHIIGRYLPPELRTHIEEYLTTRLVRLDWQITYKLTLINNDYVKVETRSAYTMENRSPTEQDYPCRFKVERCLLSDDEKARMGIPKAESSIDRVLCIRGEHDSIDYPGPTTSEEESTATHVVFAKKVSLPRHDAEARRWPRFELESTEYHRVGSLAPFVSHYVVMSTRFAVEYPEDKIDVNLELSIGALEDVKRVRTTAGAEWNFLKPLLPGQVFTVRFEKRRPSGGP